MDAPKKRRFSFSNSYFGFIFRRKISDRFLYNLAVLAFFVTSIIAIVTVNNHFTTSIPSSGGTLVEGIVGTPRFVNPVLAINRADHDMVALIYSGLMKLDEQGLLINDLAESITLSEDKLTYTVKLRNGVQFHNGTKLTADDFVYTISLIQNPDLKSPLRGNWDGVKVEKSSDTELTITLEEPYTPFLENLTVGILPRELWNELPIEQIPFSQHNTEPIGTGPYSITDVLRNKTGLINGYKLEAFATANQNPNITTLVFNFYQNEEELLQALKNKEIASTPSLSPEFFSQIDAETYEIIETPLPRTFGIYFNQNKSATLRDENVRKALEILIDREKLVDTVLYGFGIPTSSPIPPGFIPVESTDSQRPEKVAADKKIIAEGMLTDGGWKKTEAGTWEKEIEKNMVTLAVTISTANTPLFDQTATYISEEWKSIGVDVQIAQFEQNDLVQGIIRPRDFEALLYGSDIGRQTDLYPFWHSSQKSDPGLNIAQYTNIDVDMILEKLRTETDTQIQTEEKHKVEKIIIDEKPAIFLFVPTFGYILDKSVTATTFERLSKQSERFANVAKWHIKSNNVWPIFSNN